MNNRIYIVTGAAGFLGGAVCRQLIERGEKVRAFVLPNDPAAKYIPDGIEVIYGDLCDKESLERLFTVPDEATSIVLHIASIVTVNPDYSRKVIDVNVGGTKNIVDMCLAHPECERLVYCSSTGAIPEVPKGKRISEVDFFDEDKVEGCYSMSKAMATQAVLDAVRERGLNACVVHPSGIMGPEDFAVGETTGTLIKIIGGEMPMGISGTFNLCDVRDLAAGMIAAADKGKQGECYILGNEAISFKEFCRLVSEEANCKAPKAFLPIPVANLIAKLSEMRAKRTGVKPLMTTFSVYNLARNNEFDSSKAKRELGYRTRSYKETIHDEIKWLKTSGKIA